MNKEGLRGIKFGYGRDTPDPRRAQQIGDSSCPTPRGLCVWRKVSEPSFCSACRYLSFLPVDTKSTSPQSLRSLTVFLADRPSRTLQPQLSCPQGFTSPSTNTFLPLPMFALITEPPICTDELLKAHCGNPSH